MRLHDRYLFRELLTPLGYCLGGFLPLWVCFFFFTKLDEIRDAKLKGLETMEFCFASLPEFFILLLPWLLLLSMLYALTQHARHNEITALRAAGISLWRVCAPYFIVGFVSVFFYFALNEIAVPVCQRLSIEIITRHVHKANDLRIKTSFTKLGFTNQAEHRSWVIGNTTPPPPRCSVLMSNGFSRMARSGS